MFRRLWSWCWAAVLLGVLGHSGAAHAMRVIQLDYRRLGCVDKAGRSAVHESPDRRFKLELSMKQGEAGKPPAYELKMFRGAKPAWNMVFKELVTLPYTWLSPDGRHVVLLRPNGQLVLVDSQGLMRGSWDMRKHLSTAEKARLPKDLCEDRSWAQKARFTGDAFELEVPPTEVLSKSRERYKTGIFRLDLKAERFERDGEPLAGDDPGLIQSFEADESPEVRLRLADELLGRSQISEHLKSRELSAFWNKLLQTPELSPKVLHRMAVEAVAAYGLDSEVRALARLPGEIEERDIAVLDVLERRFPEDAGEYALRVLESRHSSPAVRRRALELLLGSNAARDIGVGFALSDSSKELRRIALSPLLQRPFTPARFEQVLGFCADPDPMVQYRVMSFALDTLSEVDASEREQFIDVLRRSELGLQIGQCPDVSLALGALSDKEGDRPRALELYVRGLRGLQELKDAAMSVSAQLRVDAMLQLALEAEKKGERAEAERYARGVLADPSRRLPVCAPQPSPKAMPWASGDCLPERKAEQAARELLKRLKSKARGG